MNVISAEDTTDSSRKIDDGVSEKKGGELNSDPNALVNNLNSILSSPESIPTAKLSNSQPGSIRNNEVEPDFSDNHRNEHERIVVEEGIHEPRVSITESEGEQPHSARAGGDESKSRIRKYLGCVIVTAVAASFLGAFVYGRS